MTTSKAPSLLSQEIPMAEPLADTPDYTKIYLTHQSMLNVPGGSKFPPVRPWKAPWLRSNINLNQSKLAPKGLIPLTNVVFSTAWAGIRNRDGHYFTLAVVVLPPACVGDFDLAAAIFGRIARSLPFCAYGGDIISILNRSSVDYHMRDWRISWRDRWHFQCTHTPWTWPQEPAAPFCS